MSKSEKSSSDGGKKSPKARQDKPQRKSQELDFQPYACSNCRAIIDPDYVWHMESTPNGNVMVTHHCSCCHNDFYTYVTGRYPFSAMAVLMLMRWDDSAVTFSPDQMWSWDAPYRMAFVNGAAPQLLAMRDQLVKVNTPKDFLRECGAEWPHGVFNPDDPPPFEPHRR